MKPAHTLLISVLLDCKASNKYLYFHFTVSARNIGWLYQINCIVISLACCQMLCMMCVYSDNLVVLTRFAVI